jgi:Mce-associated membrane protein
VVLVFLALVGLTVYLAVRNHDRAQSRQQTAAVAAREQALLTAARSEAVALTTLSYQSASAGLNRILAGATGALRQQFASERAKLPGLLARNQSVSTGTVLAAGLVPPASGDEVSATRPQAVVAVDATVTSKGDPRGVIKHYRMVVTLQQVSGRWLANDVAFAGVPS